MNSFLFVAGQRWLAASWLDVKECIAKFCFYDCHIIGGRSDVFMSHCDVFMIVTLKGEEGGVRESHNKPPGSEKKSI